MLPLASASARAITVRSKLSSLSARDAGPGAPASPEALYVSERALLQGYRVVPLFHLPEIYGLGSRVRNWTATSWGAWKLDNVWLTGDKP